MGRERRRGSEETEEGRDGKEEEKNEERGVEKTKGEEETETRTRYAYTYTKLRNSLARNAQNSPQGVSLSSCTFRSRPFSTEHRMLRTQLANQQEKDDMGVSILVVLEFPGVSLLSPGATRLCPDLYVGICPPIHPNNRNH